jgi:hypothetical protein
MEASQMTLSKRSVLTALTVGGIAAALMGCAPSRPESPPADARLKRINTKVPKLADLPLRKAETVLSFVALRIGDVVLEETKDASLHGKVFDQDPAPGTPVRGGTAVNVKVYRFVPEKKKSPSPPEK